MAIKDLEQLSLLFLYFGFVSLISDTFIYAIPGNYFRVQFDHLGEGNYMTESTEFQGRYVRIANVMERTHLLFDRSISSHEEEVQRPE
jgi:hypothetical protein